MSDRTPTVHDPRRWFSPENLVACAVAVLLIVGALGFSLWVTRARSPGDPQLVFSPPYVDLGVLPQEHELLPRIELVNRATSPVRITGVNTTCGCTVVPEQLLGQTIAGGGRLAVPLKFRTGLDQGTRLAEVLVTGQRDGRKVTARMQLYAVIRPEFNVEPKYLDFGTLSPGQSAQRRITILPQACTNLMIRSARMDSSEFEVSLDQPAQAAQTNALEVTVSCRAPLTSGRVQMVLTLTLETSSSRIPTVRVPVVARVSPEIVVTPPLLVWSGEATGESRITLESQAPCRIVRLLVETRGGTVEPLGADAWLEDADTWDTWHVCRIPNRALAQAKQLTFELAVRNAPERTEARSVSVPIKRLLETQNDTVP